MCEGEYKFYGPKKVCNCLIIIVPREIFAMRYFEKVCITRMIKEHTIISKIEKKNVIYHMSVRNGYEIHRKPKFEINHRVANCPGRYAITIGDTG